ncbi:uncharacterized protein si:dkey-12j5.1 isoform X1 [Callorhinchus milii]|uniref:uncharacterized protein si:dkey-12j5.1 isoform X1 n=1 Tax=Callorhinchus milii TaxID=7868 RepID=UPI001C3FB01D|nr:uncharacterized protein si:dkey-12j5.1 isoform X1 [Callorhinchus milii]
MAGQSRGRRSRASGFEMAGLSAQDRMRQKMEKKAKKKTEAKYSVQQLLEKAEDCMDNFNFELAQMFCQRALDLEPDNITVLEMMGNIFAELGNSEKAKEVFQRSVELRPEEGHAKYMYLGQIHGGEEAVQYFRKGTELMIREYQKQKELVTQAAACDPDNLEVTSQNISTAFCSVAEIFLTDLCLEEGAADNCKEALEKALEYDPSNPEALQLMASYLFSTEQQQEGKTFLMKSIEQWLPSYQKAVTEQQSQGDDDSEQLQNLFPPYESRITTGKLLIEAEEYEECQGNPGIASPDVGAAGGTWRNLDFPELLLRFLRGSWKRMMKLYRFGICWDGFVIFKQRSRIRRLHSRNLPGHTSRKLKSFTQSSSVMTPHCWITRSSSWQTWEVLRAQSLQTMSSLPLRISRMTLWKAVTRRKWNSDFFF